MAVILPDDIRDISQKEVPVQIDLIYQYIKYIREQLEFWGNNRMKELESLSGTGGSCECDGLEDRVKELERFLWGSTKQRVQFILDDGELLWDSTSDIKLDFVDDEGVTIWESDEDAELYLYTQHNELVYPSSMDTQSEVETLKRQVVDLFADSENSWSAIDGLRNSMDSIETQMDNLDADMEAMQGQMDDMNSDIKSAQSDISTLKTNVSTLGTNVETIQTTLGKISLYDTSGKKVWP